MTKPWSEEWAPSLSGDEVVMRDPARPPMTVTVAEFCDQRKGALYADDQARARLAAAAPAMARLLCRLEWSGTRPDSYGKHGDTLPACPSCGEGPDGHMPDCALDAALSAAGLDAEERERVRGG